MATTPQQILTAAYAKSLKNKAGTLATESGELLQLVIRSLRAMYAIAARVNPVYFADSAAVTFASGGWAKPVEAESIFRIEDSSGREVVVVPFDQRDAEPGLPAVYVMGATFRPAGNANDPTSGDLTFFYSKRPTVPASLSTPLDATWPEQFNELLIDDVAIYLAIKDDRAQEAASLKEERDRAAQLYVAHLEHNVANERRAYGHVRRFNTNTLVPLGQLLAGGGSVA